MLRGWLRIGIVLSIIWIIGAGWHQHMQDGEVAQSAASALGALCLKAAPLGDSNAAMACINREDHMRGVYMTDDSVNVAVVAFGPLLLAWLAFGLLWVAARWIAAGFRSQ